MSWEQLLGILEEARAIEKVEREKPPAECPNDGEPLQFHARKGVWWCPLGDYQTRKREA